MNGAAAGRVWAHVGQPFAPARYDVLIVGAGRMGAALARFLRVARPDLSLLLAEEGGLPNEEGATILAPGVWHADVPPERREEAERTRILLGDALTPCGLLDLQGQAGPATRPVSEVLGPDLLGWIDAGVLPHVRLDGRAGVYSAGQLTLGHAQTAIREGADLMLNVRAELHGHALDRPGSGGAARVALHRLSVTNTHQVVVDHTVNVTAARVVIAAGAPGPALVEAGLGIVTPHRAAYRQTPRLEVPSTPGTPVLRAEGLTLRPQSGGFTVVPPVPHPDPWGYVPTGGRLVGVPVGLRRETLDAVMRAMPGLSVLAGEGLVVGRSIADIPGAWLAVPAGDWPTWERLEDTHWLLLGGERADLTGLAVAEQLAQALAAT